MWKTSDGSAELVLGWRNAWEAKAKASRALDNSKNPKSRSVLSQEFADASGSLDSAIFAMLSWSARERGEGIVQFSNSLFALVLRGDKTRFRSESRLFEAGDICIGCNTCMSGVVTLRILNVQAKPLQSMSSEDIEKECLPANIEDAKKLWDSVYGGNNLLSWDSNPVVWIYDMKVIQDS